MKKMRTSSTQGEDGTPERSPAQTAFYYGWFIVATTFFISVVSVGARNGFGVFVVSMEEEFDWSRTEITMAFFTATLFGGISQPFLGRVYDRLGARKVIVAGLLIMAGATMLLSLTNHIAFLIIIYGVVISVGMGLAGMTNMGALLARWFRRKRATVIGLSTAGASLGGLILVPFAAYMLDLTGWRTTWIVLGGIMLLALPLAFLILKDDPSKMGLRPDGEPATPDGNGAGGNGARSQPRDVQGPIEVSRWKDSFRYSPMWQLCGSYFVCGFTVNIISVHFIPFAVDKGFPAGTAAIAFGVMSALNIVGVITMSTLSDRFGGKNLLGMVYGMRGFGYLILLLAPIHFGLWGFAVIAGFSWIASAALVSSLTADIYGIRSLGTLNGITFMVHQMGGAISVLFAAVAYDLTGSYTVPFTFCAMLLFVASITSFSIREKRYSVKFQTPPSTGPSVAAG